jgi:RNA polymerase sigma factor (TIGR02999 family)
VTDSIEFRLAVPNADNITQLLLEVKAGNADAMTRLMPIVYRELRRLAGHYFRQERPGHTLQPTALVHEAYLRLVGQTDRNWQNRAHFFAVAAQTMRGVLVDHARANLARKRGGRQVHVELDHSLNLAAPKPQAILVLDETLKRLEQIDPRASRVVELRWFVGLSVEEAAHVMGISEKTVRRDWNFAKAWLQTELDGLSLPDRAS